MSSRSLAAARSKRAGESSPPVSGNRPVTSIGSYAAFGQQPPNQPQNVRVSRGQQPPNTYQQPPNTYQQPPNTYQQPPSQIQQPPSQSQNGLPFTKLSISDAIGLITIRLGRVEQWIIETDHENEENDHSSNLPDGSRIIDNSILTNFVNRLDSLEKREVAPGNTSDDFTKLVEDVGKMNVHLAKIVEESSKHSLVTAKHTEQLFRFEREFIETKDILKTFMLKYDQFANETSDKFGDFEYVISELEKNILPSQQVDNEEKSNELYNEENVNDISNEENVNDISNEENVNELSNEENVNELSNEENVNDISNNQISSIMSFDLKKLVKKELSEY